MWQYIGKPYAAFGGHFVMGVLDVLWIPHSLGDVFYVWLAVGSALDILSRHSPLVHCHLSEVYI